MVVRTIRLPRSRRGKTPIDVNYIEQPSNPHPRVRLSIGEDNTPGRKNSDLDIKETEDLITLLQYHLAMVKGEVPRNG